jgi:hypothetical protein
MDVAVAVDRSVSDAAPISGFHRHSIDFRDDRAGFFALEILGRHPFEMFTGLVSRVGFM